MTFEIIWTPTAAEHLKYWQEHDIKKVVKIKKLCESLINTPEDGIGKPEKLKYFGKNLWSRRIDHEHRLVYQVKESKIYIIQCRYHY